MRNENSQFAKKYALGFALFCLLAAALTVLLAALVYRIGGIAPNGDGAAAPTVSEQQANSITVVIDAGHGGEDGGAVGVCGAIEKDLNLEISKLLADMLRANGINVVMTRTEDILLYDPDSDYKGHKKMLDLAARLKIARETENSIFVSIHMNSFTQPQYSGLQVYYSKNDPLSKSIADIIQSNVKKYVQSFNSRKSKPATSAIFLLDRLDTPAVLIECGFLSNYDECLLLSSAEYRERLSFVIFCSLMDHISANSP